MYSYGPEEALQHITVANALLAKKAVETNTWIQGPKRK
jgi:hypothetical protein